MPQTLLFGLSKDSIKKLKSVFSLYTEIEAVKIYGSRAKESFKPNSDIDITLLGEGLSTTTLLQVESKLEDLLLPYKIDLSIFKHIDNEDLLKHIDSFGKFLYKKDPCF